MKRMIKNSDTALLNQVTAELRGKYEIVASYLVDDSFVAPCYMIFRSNGVNVYRAIFGSRFGTGQLTLVLQVIEEAYNVVNGVPTQFDQADDYKVSDDVTAETIGRTIIKHVSEFDARHPEFTQYYED